MATARTVQEIVYRALRLIHVIRADETPETADVTSAMETLQDMMAAWSEEGLLIPVDYGDFQPDCRNRLIHGRGKWQSLPGHGAPKLYSGCLRAGLRQL